MHTWNRASDWLRPALNMIMRDRQPRDDRPTYNIEISMKFSHTGSSASFLHRFNCRPFIEMWIIAFTRVQRCRPIVTSDSVQITLTITIPYISDISTNRLSWWCSGSASDS